MGGESRTGHLSTPSEPILNEESNQSQEPDSHSHVDLPQMCIHSFGVSFRGNTYCNPTRLKVNSAMRVDSLRPLMDGVPAHRAACGMIVSRVRAYAFPRLLTQNWSSQWVGARLEAGYGSVRRRAVVRVLGRLNGVFGTVREGGFSWRILFNLSILRLGRKGNWAYSRTRLS